ncbi:PLPL4-like protein [Mya arenaria]|uniref:PLPL4-like protein n=1 Tax=Mya arenaria TaxID=6604 RepID=A0ABY7G250_MYAAR|nr:PLPL4-like protein [Mya arenaria]
MNISFCGAGFLGIYHMGVLKALRSSAPKFLSRIERVGGASAGSLAGVVLVCEPEKVEECTQFNLALSDEVRRKPLGSFTPNYNLLDSVRAFIDSTLSHDAHHRANGILYISLTSFDGRIPNGRRVNEQSHHISGRPNSNSFSILRASRHLSERRYRSKYACSHEKPNIPSKPEERGTRCARDVPTVT